jgi:hypothetical protein
LRKKLTTAFLALVCAASVVIACQPALDNGRPTRRRLAEAVPASGTEAAPTTAAAGVGPTILLTTPSTTLAPATPTTIGVARPSPLPPASPGGDIEEEWYGSGPRVAILGDSLTVQARPAIRALAAGSYALKIGALYGEGMSGGALSAHRPEPLMPEVVARYAEEPPDVVVLALGTNDVWLEGLGPASFERAWQEATRAFDRACTVGVTVTETDDAPGYDPEE